MLTHLLPFVVHEHVNTLRADRFQHFAKQVVRNHQSEGLQGLAQAKQERKRTFVRNLERFVKQEAERVFARPFRKVRPEWLRNWKTGRCLEIDLYCEELQLAIEIQGRQHYQYLPNFYRSETEFQAAVGRDAMKRTLCQQHGTLLIEVPFTMKRGEVAPFLISEYLRLSAKKGDFTPFDPP